MTEDRSLVIHAKSGGLKVCRCLHSLIHQFQCEVLMAKPMADRIARQNRFTRFVPGQGRNGTLRYLLEEVMRYEQSRLIASVA